MESRPLTAPFTLLSPSSAVARQVEVVGAGAPLTRFEAGRPSTCGKFFRVDGQKYYVKGVTYGPLADAPGEYRTPDVVRVDFAAMRAAGVNTVRSYTVPPRWFLDAAQEHGLRVMVGLAWEQHVAFLESARAASDIVRRVARAAAEHAGHPALFAYAFGNEIPSTIVRWYGHRRIEQYLRELHLAVKEADSEALSTYVNYPSTEYLELPFLDFCSFNVYLESPASFTRYVARLQNMAGDRPLVMAEVGFDGLRHGEAAQARAMRWQVRRAFRGGCAGLFVFAWTDEWSRGGEDVVGWEFGLTARDRRPKPALAAVRKAFAAAPFRRRATVGDSAAAGTLGISVVVCTRNGAATLRWCLDGLCALAYPDYEVIVIDDGSTDDSAAVASAYADRGVRLIRTPNRGLSQARNEGIAAARMPIVAFLDDDARPDPHWLDYLADTFRRTRHVGVGGPNVPPPGFGAVADAVALAPGGPVHVLLTDDVAEHIPGCNMAFRRECLQAVGGFDAQFRIAGDDVDLCWRLQARGWTLGFNPAAMVWHRRRATLRAYWKQQLNYGRAEADLERKWPEKYNAVGHLTWAGRLYRSNGLLQAISWWARRRIYHGTWGGALFQSVYHAPPSWVWTLPTMPEWYLLVFLLGALASLGRFWHPLYALAPLFAFAAAAPLWHAARSAREAVAARRGSTAEHRRLLALTALLNVLQPLARLYGRVDRGLTPWRRRAAGGFVLPRPLTLLSWAQDLRAWRSQPDRLQALESALASHGTVVIRGGDFDRWDVEVRGGALGAVRTRLVVEEHGGGRQLARLRAWPRYAPRGLVLAGAFAAVAACAAVDRALVPALVLGVAAITILGRTLYETGTALWAVRSAMGQDPGVVSVPAASESAHGHQAAPDHDDDGDALALAGGLP